MSLQRLICNGNEQLIHVDDQCNHELGRVRGVILFDLSFDINTFIAKMQSEKEDDNAVALDMFIAGLANNTAHIIPKTAGSFNGGEPQTAKGFNDGEVRLLRHNYSLQFKDPAFRDNKDFYEKAEMRQWYVVWRTETLLRIVNTPANIIVTDPVDDDVNSSITWNVDLTWQSKRKAEITSIGVLADYFDCKIIPQTKNGHAYLLASSDMKTITELTDLRKGWDWLNTTFDEIYSLYPDLTKITANCRSIYSDKFLVHTQTADSDTVLTKLTELNMPELETIDVVTDSSSAVYKNFIFSAISVETLDFPKLKSVMFHDRYSAYHGFVRKAEMLRTVNMPLIETLSGEFMDCQLLEELSFPNLKNANCIARDCENLKRVDCPELENTDIYSIYNAHGYYPTLLSNLPNLEYANFPKLTTYTVYGAGNGKDSMQNMPKLKHLIIGQIVFTRGNAWYTYALDGCHSLILLDVRGELNKNLFFNHWSPKYALLTEDLYEDGELVCTKDSLVDAGETYTNNREKFLANFKTYIAQRVADRTGMLATTIFISQEVRDILTEEIETIFYNKNWNIAPAKSI